jgi:RNA-binding protein
LLIAMSLPSLSGAQKTKLRGLGQNLADSIRLGQDGLTPPLMVELNRQLDTRELVKLRFTGGQDRHVRVALCEQIAQTASCLCLGTVGHTALFWRAADLASSKLLVDAALTSSRLP